uniref:SFRICE_025480 n=1 Tax=Spodoptera frugiperda TaxID=7108 RepID=A0A2H1WB75_SPOFR
MDIVIVYPAHYQTTVGQWLDTLVLRHWISRAVQLGSQALSWHGGPTTWQARCPESNAVFHIFLWVGNALVTALVLWVFMGGDDRLLSSDVVIVDGTDNISPLA